MHRKNGDKHGPPDIQQKNNRRPEKSGLAVNIRRAGIAAEEQTRIALTGQLEKNNGEIDGARQISNDAD